MGYKHRQDRRRSASSATSVLAATIAPHVPRKKPIPSSKRDSLTGIPLTRNTPYIVVRNYAKLRTCMNHGEYEAKLDCIPNDIHRLHGDTIENRCSQDGLGAPQWTKAFKQYIRVNELLQSPAERRAEHLYTFWWEHANAEQELYAQFPSDVVDAVLFVRRDGGDWYDAASRIGKDIQFLVRRERKMAKYIRSLNSNRCETIAS